MNHKTFLQSQIPLWLEKGWITESTAHEMLAHYEQSAATAAMHKPTKNSWASIIMSILGAILIGSGIILIFAYNWDAFSRFQRTILCFMPLLIAQAAYGYAFFKKSDSTAWAESTAVFLMLALASCMALISQTYNLPGTTTDFVWTWSILSIPLLYLSNATLVAMLYLCCISGWAVSTGSHGESIWYWLLLLAAVPHLWKNLSLLRKDNQPLQFVTFGERARANLLGWTLAITFVIAIHNVLENRIELNWLMGDAIFFTLMYVLGKQFFGGERSMWLRPFQTTAIAGIFVLSIFLTYEWYNSKNMFNFSEWFSGDSYPPMATWINFAILLVSVVTIKSIAIQHWRNEKQINYLLLSFPSIVLISVLLVKYVEPFFGQVLFNLFVFVWGLFYIKEGTRLNLIALVNAGTFFLAILFIARFFESENILLRGIAFTVIGVGFLLLNYFLTRHIREELEGKSE